jgi:molecular chaperone GrpE
LNCFDEARQDGAKNEKGCASMTNTEPFTGSPVNEEAPGAAPALDPQVPSVSSPDANAGEAGATIRRLQAENLRLYDRLLSTQAELENSRKRMQREKEDFLEHANAELIRQLLPSLDAFERALKHRDQRVPDGFYEGMELIYGGLLQVLERAGLARIEVLGRTFDPHLHQAVETVEDEHRREHEIVEELLPGFTFRQQLLRPSMVKVAVAKRQNDQNGIARDE